MICPHCGKPATAIRGRCSACTGVLGSSDAPAEAGAVAPISPEILTADQQATIELSSRTRGQTRHTHEALAPPGLPHTTNESIGSGTSTRSRPIVTGPLVPGEAFGNRYHVIRM